ncbi:shikimate dehydrogenase [Ferruginibacter lapsinanis]|uniref:shikimate dehydrogenase family protein n=1 Tax=Ferruginibacter lapsinanis TaxID=563172 RepID=UPI001E3CE7DE|nr:shikimate dehydrogenase [Ferruginibacter lapsinanis]UEG48521.1 shikimate dehydrogenase [Ferruginibacter lapsinanis]
MKLYGLIGYPLGHSFSKQYFTEKFEREGIADAKFEAFPISTIEAFPALIKNNPSLKGLSVTIPYKEQVLQFVTELSDEVKVIGATNSIKISGDKLIAYNTDIIGFERSFKEFYKPSHKKALILGTGGASKAVQYVFKKMGIDFIIVSRKKDATQNIIDYSMIDAPLLSTHTVIVNTTPVGMSPNEDAYPDIPYYLLTPSHYLYDLVYKPAETVFLEKGAAIGAIVKNGYDMLLLQAEASWAIWNS